MKPAPAPHAMRRRLLGAAGAWMAAGMAGAHAVPRSPTWLPAPAVPDVPLLDQDNRAVRLPRELQAARIAIVNFMFTGCQTVCPPQTALLREALRLLEETQPDALRGLRVLSITVDPLGDGPAQLRAYGQRFGLPMDAERSDGRWILLTGRPPDVARLLAAFDVPARGPGDHPSLLWLGDTARGRWTRSSSMNPPASLAALVQELQR